MKLLLYPHGGSGNHGCEAIVRSSLKILQPEAAILMSGAVEEDIRYGLDAYCDVRSAQRAINRLSWGYLKARIQLLRGDSRAIDLLSFAPVLEAAEECDVTLSIGGDNYCYGAPAYIYLINKELRRRGKKTSLWGCSVEPSSIKGEMLEDLSGYDLIVARESITFNAMKNAGLKRVSLFPDPAFALHRVDLPLPEGFVEGNTVGINVSPMIQYHERDEGVTMLNYEYLIQHLIDTTDMQVALIPHVVWDHNDDKKPLRHLYEKFQHTSRVVLLNDCNAEELKGFIARCRFMIAARTHASIAAYSKQVPTLVVGYSVKARGIATDLFGTDENYVLPVQSLSESDDLANAFDWLQQHEKDIRKHYSVMMPKYIARTEEMKPIIESL